ncbi:hypothetical protein A3C20_02425 [Candidatus Kaiserbacteria bacterium RIFCSPHIGHO2_02_FULL_55_25]|uniref:Uncharacterized protein n=2 Tax=Parcubacteria group TaxID=1794811 RepID=A0A1F4Y0K3_9BACT|nr:MAG: hypothetical protein A3B33_02425 [Candidatus Adlerbacteria bacterium RIFCSPLOWO2_01_FULL_54_16]OGG69842.1 MAG: hypothetical protein A3C20_02425 [Candidatus Kaiserbacteria bacterium RIFCSPHIGHO2_02_FULL_55_25]
MDTKAIGRGALTSTDLLALFAGERRYGAADLTTQAIFQQPIPKGMQPMVDDLRMQLQLPKLDRNADRKAIYAAYGHDITLLDTWRTGFKMFINSAVGASIIRPAPIKVVGKDIDVFSYLEAHMPEMARMPLVDFTAEIAAWPEQELLTHLKSQMDVAVTMLFNIICLWLDSMVAREFVGLLKVTGTDTGRYHYFRPLQIEKALEKSIPRTERVGYDATQPFGRRTQYETRADGLVEITHQLERHDHDIVDMQMHTLADYPYPMPSRVVRFLESTPDFIRRHLKVVSGMIVKEQMLKRTTDIETVQATIIESTWLDSPAIVLGGLYAPIGWNGRDMAKEVMNFFSGQKACPPPPNGVQKVALWFKGHWWRAVILSLIASLLLIPSVFYMTMGYDAAVNASMVEVAVICVCDFVRWILYLLNEL